MPRFVYQVRDGSGRTSTGAVMADDVLEASRQLRRDGKTIVTLREEALGSNQGFAGLVRKIKRDDVIYFASQLAVMVDTGVPLPEALDAIAGQTEHPGLKTVLNDICENVKGGMTFSAALERYPKVFGKLFVALMRASEASGTMGQMLQRVSEYLVQERDTRKQIKGAMTYPVCMLAFCVVVVVALLVFVLPKFDNIYKGKGALLPTPTRALLGLSNAIISYWPFIIGCLAAISAWAYFYFRSKAGRLLLDKTRISLPLIGAMYRKAYLARSLRTMATMVSTGVSVLEGLAITAEAAGNSLFAKVWTDLAERVKEGSSISDELCNCRLMPRTVAQMVGAGERTGKLGMVMNRVADFCEADLRMAIKTLTQMIEPVMVVVMGLIVGGIAMALLLPIFTISRVTSH